MSWQSLGAPQWVYAYANDSGLWCWCEVCNAEEGPTNDQGLEMFAEAHAQHQSASPTQLGLGDVATPFLSAAAKALGIEHCTPCEQRRLAMNNFMPAMPFTRRR